MQKIPWKEKLHYGLGATGLDLSYGLFYSYLSIYLTDVLGVKALFLLILAPLARLWDGFNDPMMGVIVDRTNTKWGKRRPWILIGASLNAVVLLLLFNNPLKQGSALLYVYVAVFYVLWGMTNTLADIPYWSMVPSFTSDEKERNTISTVARTFSGAGQGIISLGVPVALKQLGDGTNDNVNAQGFGRIAAIASVFLVLFAAISVLGTKERRIVTSKEHFSFKKAVQNIKSNDQLLVFMLFAMLSNGGYYMTSGISGYYFRAVKGDIGLLSAFNLYGAVGSVLSIAVVPIFSRFLTNRDIYKGCLITAIAGYVGMGIAGIGFDASAETLGMFYFIASIGIGSMFVNQTIMLSDVVDYGEYRSGNRNEALTFSMKGFLQKMAYTFQSVIMYAAFWFTKYNGLENAKAAANPAAQNAISVLMFAVPPVMIALSLFVFLTKYKVYGKLKKDVIDAINQKYNPTENNNPDERFE